MKHLSHLGRIFSQFILVSLFLALISATPSMAASTLTVDVAVSISTSLRAYAPNLEPSDMVWHSRLGKFVIVGDEGEVCTMDQDGANPSCKDIGAYDLEGVTIADVSTNDVYLGVEYKYIESESRYEIQILEYDLSAQALTGKKWNLATDMGGNSSTGMESLTFVPNGAHPYSDSSSGGVFYAGSQYDGKIYIYDVNLSVSGTKTFLGSFTVKSGYTDLAALHYSEDTDSLFIVIDNRDLLIEMTTDGVSIVEYTLPGDDQEGFAIVTSCDDGIAALYTSEDSGYAAGPDAWEFDNFSITCVSEPVDNDGDGVNEDLDCNDSDASISSLQTYYQDLDGDGLGSSVITSVCANSAPAGYVTNSTDANDSDYDNDGTSSSADCNDRDASVSSLQTYYQDLDADGLGSSVSTSVCANSAPTGYVTNSTDANDSDYDNDGVSTSADCNDRDASISSNTTYYLDYDGDGLGDPASSTSVCSNSAPSGYVSNSSDTDDSGSTTTTTTTYGPIEYSTNAIDDDGDGLVDEDNTVAENDYHPTYSTASVSSRSAYRSNVSAIYGSTNGAIRVKYADGSIYKYTIFSVTTSSNTSVRSYYSTGYLIVTSADRTQWALVNAYTGEVYYTIR